MPEQQFVIRYVVTHLNRFGLRTLAHVQQGANTYETVAEAQAWIDAAIKQNGPRLAELYGLPLEVRPCKCYPGHFDPMERYFDE